MIPQQVRVSKRSPLCLGEAPFSTLLGSQRGQALISPQKPQVKVFMAWQLTKATSTSAGHSLTLSSVLFFFVVSLIFKWC